MKRQGHGSEIALFNGVAVVKERVRALSFILRSGASGFIRHVQVSTCRDTFPKWDSILRTATVTPINWDQGDPVILGAVETSWDEKKGTRAVAPSHISYGSTAEGDKRYEITQHTMGGQF